MYTQELKIPEDRVAVFIGKSGKVKRFFEKKLEIKISVNTEGDVTLYGEDGLNLRIGSEIARAVGRGFNPEIAKNLLDDNYAMEIIDMTDYAGKNRQKLIRLRGRCIGTRGKVRKTIEGLTNTNISVYGKTVAIIGDVQIIEYVREAFETILRGGKYGTVYMILEKRKKKAL